MRKSECETFHWTHSVNCARADDSLFGARVEVEGVRDISNGVSGFLLFFAESGEEERMAAQLREVRERVSRLQNQLIPSDVQGFIRDGRTDFAFQTKTVCVAAVQISAFTAHLRQMGTAPFLECVRTLWARATIRCAEHPPMVRQSGLSDTFIAVAGLFSADDPKVYAKAAVEWAKDVLEGVQRTEPELRLQIGITVGGPLVCGLAGTTHSIFTATGAAIDDAVSLAEVSTPNRILVSAAAKELLADVEFEGGADPTRASFVRGATLERSRGRADKIMFSSQVSLPGPEVVAAVEMPDIEEIPEGG
jgi:class 3 adenylate cyclase